MTSLDYFVTSEEHTTIGFIHPSKSIIRCNGFTLHLKIIIMFKACFAHQNVSLMRELAFINHDDKEPPTRTTRVQNRVYDCGGTKKRNQGYQKRCATNVTSSQRTHASYAAPSKLSQRKSSLSTK